MVRSDFRVLGPFEVRVEATAVPLGGPRQQAVLALLLLEHGAPVTSDRLVDDLWRGSPPPSAVNTLHAYVARLRKALGPAGGRLRTAAQGYVLDAADDEVDIWRFEAALSGALSLAAAQQWSGAARALGPVLNGWTGAFLTGGLGWEPWASAHLVRLSDRRLSAVETLAEAELALGHHSAAVLLLEDVVRQQPHREHLVTLLMLAYYRSGRQSEALAAYLRCRRVLAEELGVEPSVELSDMQHAVLGQQPVLAWAPFPDARPRKLLPIRNPRFSGRRQLLSAVAAELDREQVVICTGLNGSGKSSIALEVAHAHGGFACWVAGDNDATVAASLTALAVGRDLPPVTDQAVLSGRLWDDLAGEEDPLVVFDNVDDPAALTPYLPPRPFKVLVTSRNAGWSEIGSTVAVGPFEPRESAAFLLARTSTRAVGDATDLAQSLGHLPLALVQASAYIAQAGITVQEYAELFERRRYELLLRGSVDSYPGTVGTTWLLAFEEIAARSPGAALLLEVMAFLSPDGVGTDLIRPLWDDPDPDLAIADAIAQLRRYSLIDRDGSTLRIHRLVQTVIRARLDPGTRLGRLHTAFGLLARADPGDPTSPTTWARWSVLAPQALVVGGHAAAIGAGSDALVSVLRRSALYLKQRASFRAALTLTTTAIEVAERTAAGGQLLGELNSEYGDLLDASGNLWAARDAHTRALRLLEAELDPEDARIALARVRLGHVLNCAGDPTGAVALHELALKTLRGRPDQRDTARALVDIGYAQWSAHRHGDAARIFGEALDLLGRLSTDNPDLTANALAGLGMACQDGGDLGRARTLQSQALGIWLDLFGDVDHPEIAQALDKLGYVTRLMGEVTAAVGLHARAEAMLARVLGETDPRVAMAATNHGLALLAAGDLTQAVTAQERALRIFSATYGPAHPHTGLAADRLADARATADRVTSERLADARAAADRLADAGAAALAARYCSSR